MKINTKEIRELIESGNLTNVSREIGIPKRTLDNYRYGQSKNLETALNLVEKLQTYINQEENKMKLSANEVKELGVLDQVGNNEKILRIRKCKTRE